MPKGPKDEKRPANVIGNAVRVMEIATGQRDEDDPGKDKAAAKLAARRHGFSRSDRHKLCAKLEHADLARALGGSVQAVRQARLSNGCAQLLDRRQQTGRMP